MPASLTAAGHVEQSRFRHPQRAHARQLDGSQKRQLDPIGG